VDDLYQQFAADLREKDRSEYTITGYLTVSTWSTISSRQLPPSTASWLPSVPGWPGPVTGG